MEFVNKMKKEGKLIMGIGHRVKSVSSRSILPFFGGGISLFGLGMDHQHHRKYSGLE